MFPPWTIHVYVWLVKCFLRLSSGAEFQKTLLEQKQVRVIKNWLGELAKRAGFSSFAFQPPLDEHF